jgi:hypothetical protein
VLRFHALPGLDDVGGNRPLEEELGLGGLDGLAEGLIEAVAEGLAFLLRVREPIERAEEILLGVDDFDLDAEPGEIALHLPRLILAHKPVVDEDHFEPLAHRAVGQHGADRTVNAPRERAYDPAVADGFHHLIDASADEPRTIHRFSPSTG